MMPMRNLYTLLALCLFVAAVVPATAQLLEPEEKDPKRGNYDRHAIPGQYTLGFFADDRGSTNELEIEKDAPGFELWLGVSGDSTRVFSGLGMSLELPNGVELAGPVVWLPRNDLKTSGNLLGEGMTADYRKSYYWLTLARAQEREIADQFLQKVRGQLSGDDIAQADEAVKAFSPG